MTTEQATARLRQEVRWLVREYQSNHHLMSIAQLTEVRDALVRKMELLKTYDRVSI